MAAPIVAAYSDSLGKVFLCAAPVGVVGFVVSLFLKEVPLRQIDAISATDLGEGFGMPAGESSEKMLEVAVGRMFRDSPEIRLRSLAAQPGSRLDVALLWALIQIYRHDQVFGRRGSPVSPNDCEFPYEVVEPTFDRLVDRGYAWRTGDQLGLTQTGARQVSAVRTAIVDRITHKLGQSQTFEGQLDRDKVEAALERIAGRMLVQREWFDDRELVGCGELERVQFPARVHHPMSRIGDFPDDDVAGWILKSPEIGVAMAEVLAGGLQPQPAAHAGA